MDNRSKEEFLEYLLPNRQRLSNFARAMCKNNEDAKDVIAETILSVFENWEKINEKKAFLSYMFTTATRIYRKMYKRNRFFTLFESEQEENIPSNFATSSKYDADVLYKLLNKLPDKQKEAIVLFEISGLSLEEIQIIQGGTLSGVKTRLKRAREKLKNMLSADIKNYNLAGEEKIINSNAFAINLKVSNE
jgi:RNA polymerase sigma-70 factor (ECF subfamily)